jgi:hypothetical protein
LLYQHRSSIVRRINGNCLGAGLEFPRFEEEQAHASSLKVDRISTVTSLSPGARTMSFTSNKVPFLAYSY